MNSKIMLGNALNELALLKLEHDRLRSKEDRRQGDSDLARAQEREPDKHILVFDSGAKLFSGMASGLEHAAQVEGLESAEAEKLDKLSLLFGKGAEGSELAAAIGEDIKGMDEDVRAALDALPRAQDRADLLALLHRLGNALTGQKPPSA